MIYCVEDDAGIRELMLYTLQTVGFDAEGFGRAKPFWRAIRQQTPQLVLLDIMLPEEDGISILKKLRSDPVTSSIPVIFASARGSEYDRVTGLDLGADDYLSKPFGMMEMVSRIKAVLRRSKSAEMGPVLKFNGITMDTMRHKVTVEDRQISLTAKEFDLLKLFLENTGRVFTREQLLSAVWNTDFVGESRTVDVHIGTLRSKLGSEGQNIRTLRGVGYVME